MTTLALMSVRRILKLTLLCGPLGCVSLVLAADETPPDLDFIEYLGSWEESDEDWLMFTEATDKKMADDDGTPTGPVPGEKNSTELEDES